MERLYYVKDFKNEISEKLEDLELLKIENALRSFTFIFEREWRRFQSMLFKSEADSAYWLKDKTQKELLELCHVIDVRGWDFEGKYDLSDLDGRFRSFLKSDKDEDFNVSWDCTYFSVYWDQDALVKEMVPLYPCNVFAFFIALERTILFYQEEKRRITYEMIQKRIRRLNLYLLH